VPFSTRSIKMTTYPKTSPARQRELPMIRKRLAK
jgi:hypothetical protein